MTELKFGADPHGLKVLLSRDADFAQEIVTGDDSDWPDGIVLELRFADPAETVWTATVAGSSATWSEDKAAVNALLDAIEGSGKDKNVRLFANDSNWANGRVSIRD